MTMPAPTVSFVASSTSTNAPVWRLTAYGSTSNGLASRRRTRARSLSARPSAGRSSLRLDVEDGDDLVEDRARPAGRVLDAEARAGLHRSLAHPADGRLELAGRDRGIGRVAEHVSPRDVEMLREPDDDRLALHGDVERAIVRLDDSRRSRAVRTGGRAPRHPRAIRRPRPGLRSRGSRDARPTSAGSPTAPGKRR